ncbi:MAG TPA: penicillin-binding protein activator [Casimicrobiaceae bacterium]|nr:penicillin-binding protein activator [Casimicrobiaceae bacterium]
MAVVPRVRAGRARRPTVIAWRSGALAALFASFCAAQAPATSTFEPPPPGGTLMPAPDAAAEPPPAVAPVPPPTPAGPPIALVLPLGSPDYARAAEAVRDGFLAAAEAAGAKSRVRVIPHANDGVVAAFDAARDGGARVVVGPLVRDDLKAVIAAERELPITIALNQLDDAAPLPPRVYTFALAIEADARTIATRMHGDGIQSVAVIGGDTPLMRRFAHAFVGEWILLGGNLPQSFPLDASQDGLRQLRRELAKANVDAIVIAVDGPDAALVKTFAPRVSAWASGQVNQRQGPSAARDLEDVRFVDVSWIVAPETAAFAKLPRPDYASAALDRLYALGLDAYRVAEAFVDAPPDRLSFDGATGRVELSDVRQIAREGRLATFRGGTIVPLDGAR